MADLDLRKFKKDWDDRDKVLCPTCGFDYVHLGPVHVLQGKGQFMVGNEMAVKIDEGGAPGRGSAVRINMFCENNHAFYLEFQFHKGYTFVNAVPLGDLDPNKTIEELWRD